MNTTFRRLGATTAVCLAVPGGAFALDTLTVTATSGGEALIEDLRGASLLVETQAEGTADSQELLAAARADYERLIAVLYDEGRFGGTVNILIDGREAAAIQPFDAPATISTITVTVAPGPVYSFSRADIAPTAPGTDLPEAFVAGGAARTGTLRTAVSNTIAAWRQAGRAKVQLTGQSLVVDHAGDTLAADIDVAPGPLVTFGALIPEGQVRTRPERIIAIAGLPTGQTFDPDEVDEAATRLRRTGAFSSVAVTEADILGPGDTLPVTALVDEAKKRRLGFGVEVSSVDGVTVSGYWLHRNLFRGAERLRLEFEVAQLGASGGGEDYSLDLEFGRPATFRRDIDFYATATIEQLNEPSYNTQTGEIEAGLSRILTPELTVQLGLGYRFSRVSDSGGIDHFRMVTLPIELAYDGRDTALNPTAGVYADVTATPFLGLGDAENGGRLTFDARHYRGLGVDKRLVLAARLQGGAIVGASAAGVPDDYLFFSGGGGTVRGQSYQSLGVTSGGTEIGGRSYLGVQAEARFAITDKIGAVAFYDWATVSADSLPGGTGDSHSGAGLGLRYSTPVGPIRLDVAAPVSGGNAAEDVKIYIGIGQAF